MTVGSLVIVCLRPIRAAACDSPDGQHDALAAADEMPRRDAAGWDALVIEFGQPALRMSVECRSDQVGWGGVYWSGWRDLNSRPLDPQISAACPRTSADVQFSLKMGILHFDRFRWTNPNGGQNGGQTHSQTK
jgi:hypothetical protein